MGAGRGPRAGGRVGSEARDAGGGTGRGVSGAQGSKAPEQRLLLPTAARAPGCAAAATRTRATAKAPGAASSSWPGTALPPPGFARPHRPHTPASSPARRMQPGRRVPAGAELKPTASRSRQIAPRGDSREPKRFRRGARHSSSSPGRGRPPPRSARRRRRRTYRGRERGREHLTALTRLREQLSRPQGPARCNHQRVPSRRMRAQAPPPGGREGARGTLGAGVFPASAAARRGRATCARERVGG